jgi:hypothetical protein
MTPCMLFLSLGKCASENTPRPHHHSQRRGLTAILRQGICGPQHCDKPAGGQSGYPGRATLVMQHDNAVRAQHNTAFQCTGVNQRAREPPWNTTASAAQPSGPNTSRNNRRNYDRGRRPQITNRLRLTGALIPIALAMTMSRDIRTG